MSYILQLKTELAKAEKEFLELKIKAKRLINEILQNTNPYFGDDIEVIKAVEIEQAGDELLDVKEKLTSLKSKISDLKRELE